MDGCLKNKTTNKANNVVPPVYLGQLSFMHLSHRQRCRTAADAGFTAVSLFWPDVVGHRDLGGQVEELRRQAADCGIAIAQLELAPMAPSGDRQAYGRLAADIAEVAAQLGCQTIHGVALDTGLTAEDCAASMAVLAAAAARQGLTCGLEFVPFVSAVESLPEALAVVAACGASNAGVVLDVLHFLRGGCQWQLLEQLTPQQVVSIQINDAPLARPVDDYQREAMALRLLPGRGEFDIHRFVTTLRGNGIATPLTVEVANGGLAALPPAEAAQAMMGAVRPYL